MNIIVSSVMSHFFFCIRCYGRTSLHKRKMQNKSESGSSTSNATLFVCWQVYLTDGTDWQGHYCSVVVERKSALLCEAIFTLNARTECTMAMSVSMSLLQNSDNYFFRLLAVYFTPLSVVRQVHKLFQSEFSTECDLVIPLSISSILSFP
jgi:hypothetical protein